MSRKPKAEDLEATISKAADIAEITAAMNEARQLIYLRNMNVVTRELLMGLGTATGRAMADGFVGKTADWFDARANAGDYNPLVKILERYNEFPGVADTLKDLYAALPALTINQPSPLARQLAQNP